MCNLVSSDYGYNRTKDDTCERMKGYNLADDCPPGAKYFNRTKSGFRLIPGDRCLPSSVSRQLLKTEQLPCVGHEEEAGFDNAREAIRRAVSLLPKKFRTILKEVSSPKSAELALLTKSVWRCC